MSVPTATSLRDIYPEDAVPVETKRWEKLLARFKEVHGRQAEFVARSPGRVNIIGEVNNILNAQAQAQAQAGNSRVTAH